MRGKVSFDMIIDLLQSIGCMTNIEKFEKKLCYLWNIRNSIIQDPDKLQLIESNGQHYYDAKEVDRIDFNFYTAMLVFLEEQKKLI